MIKQIGDLAEELEPNTLRDWKCLLYSEVKTPPGRFLHEVVAGCAKTTDVVGWQHEGLRIEEKTATLEIVVAQNAIGNAVKRTRINANARRIRSPGVVGGNPPAG